MTAHRILAWSPSAIVFDCDGTLLDTEQHWQEARNITFRSFGLKPPAGFAERAKGVHYVECGALMAHETGKPDLADELTDALLKNFTTLVDEDPVTMPGAVALVGQLARHRPGRREQLPPEHGRDMPRPCRPAHLLQPRGGRRREHAAET